MVGHGSFDAAPVLDIHGREFQHLEQQARGLEDLAETWFPPVEQRITLRVNAR
jgi:hypothetical protein